MSQRFIQGYFLLQNCIQYFNLVNLNDRESWGLSLVIFSKLRYYNRRYSLLNKIFINKYVIIVKFVYKLIQLFNIKYDYEYNMEKYKYNLTSERLTTSGIDPAKQLPINITIDRRIKKVVSSMFLLNIDKIKLTNSLQKLR